METYISMLRGINVSGQKLIKMEALKKAYEELQFKNVTTYIQSGNVIFQYSSVESFELEQKISDQIQKKFGFEVPVLVLLPQELKEILNNNPFANDPKKDISFLHVTFLASVPKEPNMEAISQKMAPGEEFSLVGRVVYLYCPNGYGKTKLTNTFLESKLKVGATTRNWKTSNLLFTMTEENTLRY